MPRLVRGIHFTAVAVPGIPKSRRAEGWIPRTRRGMTENSGCASRPKACVHDAAFSPSSVATRPENSSATKRVSGW